mmetsp:Transcript_19885/g.29337  ORF Transcript_19885/g.29337 Transcript_19885/m.29337 type:complete len:272 (+) Transcript_19885:605-1420(+)
METDTETGADPSSEPIKPCKEARVAKIYRENVYYPFIDSIRRNMYGTGEESLDADERQKITLCKHSAARTAVEQAADISAGFRIFKALVKLITFEDVTISGHGLKRRATEALDAEKRVQLSKLKSDAIVDFLTKLPVITHRAFLVEHTEKGFILNGQKDEISRKLPDLYGLIGTKRRKWNLPMYVNGHIDEALYDQYGDDYPLDTNSSGEEVPKHQQISQENRQRAKIPSNPKQRQLRQELLEHRKFERDRIARKHYDEEQKLEEPLETPL